MILKDKLFWIIMLFLTASFIYTHFIKTPAEVNTENPSNYGFCSYYQENNICFLKYKSRINVINCSELNRKLKQCLK